MELCRRTPTGPTRALLRIAEQHPEVFRGIQLASPPAPCNLETLEP